MKNSLFISTQKSKVLLIKGMTILQKIYFSQPSEAFSNISVMSAIYPEIFICVQSVPIELTNG